MRIHAMVLAGGSGDRFGADMPKQFVRLAGEPILSRSLRAIASAGVDQIVVVAHPSWLRETEELVAGLALSTPTSIVPGGMTRNESTRNGLERLAGDDADIVVVHDAVRPLVPREVVLRSIEPILSGRADATDSVIPSADTLVVVEGDTLVEIPERARFRRGQTPQTFRLGVLRRAYEAAAAAGDLQATDDCTLVLRHVPGARIVAVPGDEVNLKITTRTDMVLADRMLQMRTLSPASTDPRPARTMDGAALYVVGGTDGIGKAIAEAATAAGARVRIDGRRTGLDIRDAAAVAKRIGEAAAALGGLDHVLCTAGVMRVGPSVEASAQELAEVIDVNVTGTLNVARAAHPYLSASRGSFTVFASSSFTLGRPNYVAYSASKAAVVNIAQGLAEEWAADGIRVNAVSPERTDTPMRRAAFPGESRLGMLQPEDVAAATLRLVLSDLTGQVLDVRRQDAAGGSTAGAIGAETTAREPPVG
ncbi:MAG TPA: bifunctional cytidylyltransferase/SDR family oxidoreductase [Candidatus Limnocylindrales bacterium]|nr:bifunctional cytidylyltransferase/SDR family oxidoreductase [Candidatus Limnocylindrales bacterium]